MGNYLGTLIAGALAVLDANGEVVYIDGNVRTYGDTYTHELITGMLDHE